MPGVNVALTRKDFSCWPKCKWFNIMLGKKKTWTENGFVKTRGMRWTLTFNIHGDPCLLGLPLREFCSTPQSFSMIIRWGFKRQSGNSIPHSFPSHPLSFSGHGHSRVAPWYNWIVLRACVWGSAGHFALNSLQKFTWGWPDGQWKKWAWVTNREKMVNNKKINGSKKEKYSNKLFIHCALNVFVAFAVMPPKCLTVHSTLWWSLSSTTVDTKVVLVPWVEVLVCGV